MDKNAVDYCFDGLDAAGRDADDVVVEDILDRCYTLVGCDTFEVVAGAVAEEQTEVLVVADSLDSHVENERADVDAALEHTLGDTEVSTGALHLGTLLTNLDHRFGEHTVLRHIAGIAVYFVDFLIGN